MPYFPNINKSQHVKMTSSNTSLDNTSDQDYSEFLNEYQTNSPHNEPEAHYEEGELEAEWLVAAGFPQLIKPFEQGLELRTSELEPILASLSMPHAEAIKQRVRALNHTVRGRTKNRQKRKPDIRDVFRDFDESSTGTRSRSATPDSLDSIHGDEVWGNTSIPSFVTIFDHGSVVDSGNGHQTLQLGKNQKQRLRRTPSAPLKGSQDIFRGSHVRCDIPMFAAEGIELLGFSRIGTIHIPRNRSGSDPSCSVGRVHGQLIQYANSDNNASGESSDECLSNTARMSSSSSSESTPQKIHLDTPPQSVQNSPSSRDGISFENMCRGTSSQDGVDVVDNSDASLEFCTDIDTINETDLKRLQAVFWLELAAIFDRNHVSLDKRKPFKRRRKEEGNLFGVSLNALIRRDQQITGRDSTLVPLFLEGLLEELGKRGAREEGILRVAGHKQKTEIIYNELESSFYQKPKKFAQLLSSASVHDLSALLKRWLRELPQPLLTNELIQLFYQCHALPQSDQAKALAIVVQMLPHENRNTLRTLIRFLNKIIDHKDHNKMNMHNVATIIAPSFFPPRYIHPTDKNSIEEQVKMAAQCCRLTNMLITRGEALFQVPNSLIEESKSNKTRQGKRVLHRRVKATTSLLHPSSGNCSNAGDTSHHHTHLQSNHQPSSHVVNVVTVDGNNTIKRQQSINPSHVHRLII
ncbi:rho GTPase-activating protein conundrum [Zeugodacus cucurbitae]|uniref:Rho GTPase-activating protein 18 n=1 Tax=Zeugodacus cucurbitae TaxID=28588 RepID=A0A0A1XHT8_ZEUCU|nr:rho GTPase-activating protein conundrum [Zeugodacus cucurbitae]XP_028899600.1 rho GTPase-activating protein conundrum [Zeugodacus cucurbitae]XP_028899601.1 rho GTPase-activating protein conundrum [Zeugodacus cucurbitae]XP_028899602.1 rho GTPase-activating protein conundrum [Zeugodacus cucurbitae]XP_028899603.1 rho GTPase-activating protein conundrum [Zeugodacus cucurbitae]XP_054090464.1 rho GTPase-activating protein conundrum [Zeugodacus cucurbitae]